jgi:hypothetical protein
MAQFNYAANDCMSYSQGEFNTTTLILALIALDAERPGFLEYCVRAGALADSGWSFTSRASNPEGSLAAQTRFREWMAEFEDGIEDVNQELKKGDR